MKRGGKMVVCLVVSLAWTMVCRAFNGDSTASGDGPYRAIVDRNIFELKPIPPPTAAAAPDTPPPPNVKLIGLMMISGHPQGIFSIQDPAPGRQPTNYVLGEDQRQAMLEVKTIDYADKKARVQIGDNISELKLEEPKATASGGSRAGFVPGQRPIMPGARGGMRGGFAPQGGFAPGGSPGFTPAGGYNPTAPSASYVPGMSPDAGGGGLPTRPVRTDTTSDAANGPPLTAEQQIIAIEQQREQYLNNNDSRAQILPPTPLTQSLLQQRDSAATGGDTSTSPTSTGGAQLPAWAQPHGTGNLAPPMP